MQRNKNEELFDIAPEWYFDVDIVLLKRPSTIKLLWKKSINKAILDIRVVRFMEEIGQTNNIYCIGFNFSEIQQVLLADILPCIDVYWYEDNTPMNERQTRLQLRNLIDYRKNVETFFTKERRSKYCRKGFNYIGMENLRKRLRSGDI